jgi:phosphoglycolate phosphatase
VSRRLDTVIWDFNGTLIDDVDPVVRSVNTQLEARGLPQLTLERYRQVFGFPVADYYRRIGLDSGAESIDSLSDEFHTVYVPMLMDCPLHDGTLEALEMFRSAGARQFVLSAMEEAALRAVVEHLGIAGFFEAVYGLGHLNADSKISRGHELLRDQDIDPRGAVMIGDTDHDAEVAEALGLGVVLVAGGHQSESRLRATGYHVLSSARAIDVDLLDKTGSALRSARRMREENRSEDDDP